MVAKISSWKDNNLQMKCTREVVKLIKKYIKQRIPFECELLDEKLKIKL